MTDTSEQPFLSFARPSLDDGEYREVQACLESGWLTTGPRAQRFEGAIADYLGRPRALAVSSATAGLHLALAALDFKPGDEVITTPLTFVATLNTIVLAGGTPVLVDVDPATLNMDVNRLESAITGRTRAIVPVHFAGLPVDLDPLYELAESRNLRVVEDCAHAIGAEYKGRKIGGFGDTQVFSFHPNKNMTTGEGGAVVSRDAELLRRVEIMRFHGIDRDAFSRFTKSGSQNYDVVAPGYKYNMMDIQAAMGLHQLPKLDGFIERRRAMAARYYDALAGRNYLSLPRTPSYAHRHAWHLLTAVLDPGTGLDRDGFVDAMKRHGIGIGIHYAVSHLFTYYRERFGFHEGQFPEAERIGARIVSLPLFPDMIDADFRRVIAALDDVFGAP